MRRRGLLFALVLLAPAPAAAEPGEPGVSRVSLEIAAGAADQAPVARLRDQLGARLVEEGFAVVPDGGGADIALRLAPRAAGWLLRATLPAETLERDVAHCGVERAEERLELVQKATELARKARLRSREVASASPPASPPSASPPSASPPSASPPSASPPSASPPSASPPFASPPSASPPSASRPAPAITLREARRQAADVDLPRRRVPTELELSAGAGVLAHGTDLQPLGGVRGRAALLPGLGLDVALGMTGATTTNYKLVEEQALVGVSRRTFAAGVLWLDAGAEVGFLVHQYRGLGGSRWFVVPDEVGLLAFKGGVALGRHLGLELSAAAGLRTANARPDVPESWSTSWYLAEGGVAVVAY